MESLDVDDVISDNSAFSAALLVDGVHDIMIAHAIAIVGIIAIMWRTLSDWVEVIIIDIIVTVIIKIGYVQI